MSDADSHSDAHEDAAPTLEVVYPLNEETEVPNTKGQLFKTVLVEGKGTRHPPHGASVRVHYVGTLLSDGSKFDSSRDRGEPFEFTLGQGQVIKGWDQGVATMLKGEKAILKCFPEYAYGASGSPPKIPPNSTLNFEVELLGWGTKEEDVSAKKDGSVLKTVLDEGSDWDKPGYESVVTIKSFLVAKPLEAADGGEVSQEVLFERPGMPWSFEVGAAQDVSGHALSPIVELCVQQMKRAERSCFKVRTAAIHDAADKETLGLNGAAAGLEYVNVEIALEAFTKVNTWSVHGEAKNEEAIKRKDVGNAYFKSGDLARAVKKYTRALEFVEDEYGFDTDEQKKAAKALRIAILGNLAQCELNLHNYSAALTHSDKVLELESQNLKAMFRKAKALHALSEWDDAAKLLEKLLQVQADPAAQAELAAVRQKQHQHLQQQKKRFAGMFEKLHSQAEDAAQQ